MQSLNVLQNRFRFSGTPASMSAGSSGTTGRCGRDRRIHGQSALCCRAAATPAGMCANPTIASRGNACFNRAVTSICRATPRSVFRRLVAVEREHRRPLRMRVVVRTAAADAHPTNAEAFEHRQHLAALAKRLIDAVIIFDHAEAGAAPRVHANRLANSVGAFRVRDGVERRDAHDDAEARHVRLDTFNHPSA